MAKISGCICWLRSFLRRVTQILDDDSDEDVGGDDDDDDEAKATTNAEANKALAAHPHGSAAGSSQAGSDLGERQHSVARPVVHQVGGGRAGGMIGTHVWWHTRRQCQGERLACGGV